MRLLAPLLLVMGVFACARVPAAEPASRFAEFSFQHPSHGDAGAAARASLQISDRLVLDASADAREHRGGGVGMASLGVGMVVQQAGATRLVVGLSADALVGDFGPDDEPFPEGMSGVSAGAGFNLEIAHRFSSRWEARSRLKVTTIDESPWVAALGMNFHAAKRLAVLGEVLRDDFGTRVGLGLRLDFSPR